MSEENKQGRKRKTLIIVCIILAVVLAALVATTVYAKYLLNRLNYTDRSSQPTLSQEEIEVLENGEDEIFFVAPEQLEYDDEGNLVYSWYDSGIKDFTEAEYTYAELRKIHKETYYIPGTGGGGIRIPTVLKIGFPVLIGVIIIWCIIKAVLRKRRKAK